MQQQVVAIVNGKKPQQPQILVEIFNLPPQCTEFQFNFLCDQAGVFGLKHQQLTMQKDCFTISCPTGQANAVVRRINKCQFVFKNMDKCVKARAEGIEDFVELTYFTIKTPQLKAQINNAIVRNGLYKYGVKIYNSMGLQQVEPGLYQFICVVENKDETIVQNFLQFQSSIIYEKEENDTIDDYSLQVNKNFRNHEELFNLCKCFGRIREIRLNKNYAVVSFCSQSCVIEAINGLQLQGFNVGQPTPIQLLNLPVGCNEQILAEIFEQLNLDLADMKTDAKISFKPDPRPADQNSGGIQCFFSVKSPQFVEEIVQALKDTPIQYSGVSGKINVHLKK